jgi:hypothetical protein
MHCDHLDALSIVTGRDGGCAVRLVQSVHEHPQSSYRKILAIVDETVLSSPTLSVVRRQQACIHQYLQRAGKTEAHNSRPWVAVYRARHAAVRKGRTRASSARAYNEFRNRFYTIFIDDIVILSTHHEQACTMKQVERQRLQQSRMDNVVVYRTLTECQIARRSKKSGLLVCDSTRKHTRTHFLYRDLTTTINLRKRLALPQHLAAFFRQSFQANRLVLCVGIGLKCASPSMKTSVLRSEGIESSLGPLNWGFTLQLPSKAATGLTDTWNTCPWPSVNDIGVALFDIAACARLKPTLHCFDIDRIT